MRSGASQHTEEGEKAALASKEIAQKGGEGGYQRWAWEEARGLTGLRYGTWRGVAVGGQRALVLTLWRSLRHRWITNRHIAVRRGQSISSPR